MKHIILCIAIVFGMIIFSKCKKKQTTFNTYFYTSNSISETKFDLFIEDEYKGELPFLTGKPSLDAADTLKQKCLYIPLKAGKYKIIAKDKQGVIISSGTIKFKRNSVHTSGGVGGIELTSNEDNLIIGLY